MVKALKFSGLLAPLAIAVALSGCTVFSGDDTPGEFVDDATITTRVEAALAAEGGVMMADRIEVETDQRVVQLSGFVPTAEQKRHAEAIAEDVDGVRAVENDIIVQ